MSNESTVKEEIKAHFFSIPDYQRAYSWEAEQLKQFVEDLRDAQDKYYLGHFLFEKSNDALMIIDGQQRITTCMIFYRAVVNYLLGRNAGEEYQKEINMFSSRLFDKDEGIPRLQTVNYDNAYFQDLIISNRETAKPSTKSQSNIKNALAYFERALGKLDVKEVLRETYLLENATITMYMVSDRAMAAQVFAYQNDRGKGLTELEKLKSYFFLLLYQNNPSEKKLKSDVEYVDQQFTTIYKQIVRIHQNEDDVLNFYWRSRCPDGYEARNRKTLDDVKATLKNEPDKAEWIRSFASELAAAFQFVEKFEGSNDEYSVRLRQLDNLALSYPFMLKAVVRLGVKEEGTVFKRLLHILENITFRSKLRGKRADIIARMNSILLAFASEDELNARIGQMKAELKNDAGWWGYWGNQEMLNSLSGYFYGNGVDNYLYWQYELSLWEKGYNGPIDVRYEQLVSNESIEHIAPQTPTDGQPVANGYGEYKNPNEPEKGIESGGWMNGIGNLMLISQSHNSSVGNKPFSDKLASYETIALMKQQMEIASFASLNEQGEKIWDLDAIKRRRQAMLDAALDIWSLDKI